MHIHLDLTPAEAQELFLAMLTGNRAERKLDSLLQTVKELQVTTSEETTLLKAMDDATTQTGNNVQKVADNVQLIATAANTISTEIDTLLANSSGVVPPEVAQQLTAISGRVSDLTVAAQASSDALDAQVPTLQSIATKGAGNPVPIPPPPVALPTLKSLSRS